MMEVIRYCRYLNTSCTTLSASSLISAKESNCANTVRRREYTILSVLKAISPMSARHGTRDRLISAPRTNDRFP